MLTQLQAAPEVLVTPHADGLQVMQVVRRALARAGYEIKVSDGWRACLPMNVRDNGTRPRSRRRDVMVRLAWRHTVRRRLNSL